MIPRWVSLRSQNTNREVNEFNSLSRLFLSLLANYYKKQNMVIITGMEARCFSVQLHALNVPG